MKKIITSVAILGIVFGASSSAFAAPVTKKPKGYGGHVEEHHDKKEDKKDDKKEKKNKTVKDRISDFLNTLRGF